MNGFFKPKPVIMMRILIVLAVLISSIAGNAQMAGFKVEGTAPGMYVSHTVLPKETLYSLGRTYNLPPAVIASFNGSNLQTGLKIGQVVKVPLNDQNFDQLNKKPAGETLVPVYHVVANGETLFRIGNNYNKVPLTSVKEWNHLSSDNVVAGKALIIGYLKVKNEQVAALKTKAPANVPGAMVAEKKTVENEMKSEPIVEASQSKPVETKTFEPITPKIEVEKKPASTEVIAENVPAKKEAVVEKSADPVVIKPAEKATVSTTAPAVINSEEGFFSASYAENYEEKKLAELTGDGGTFKSTSGWQNKKYYALASNIPSGTIIKVTSGEKSIYAKVLGELPEMKENTNLVIRLSNAATSYLGIVDPKFAVKISYYH
jgi:LysM repeat protein